MLGIVATTAKADLMQQTGLKGFTHLFDNFASNMAFLRVRLKWDPTFDSRA